MRLKEPVFGIPIILLLLLLLGCRESARQQPARPNILLVIADDWSWLHAGVYGDKVVKTPNMDRLAREGVRFTHAFCAAPSCTPSRAALLTGQYPHRLEEGANLHGTLPKKFPSYTNLLDSVGYTVGFERKGWGPGNFTVGGYAHNPAGEAYGSFADFLKKRPANAPFCFWFGSHDPHRPYEKGSGEKSGMDPAAVEVPAWLPDVPEVRKDILDYYFEIERLDRDLGQLLSVLQETGELDNTLIVITGDNGMPFPRSKATIYDSGTRVPLIIYYKDKIKAGQVVNDFVNLIDLAPTFLEVAGLDAPPEMSGKSLWPLLTTGRSESPAREAVFLERERHANVRKGDLGYPVRAIRTKDFLYVKNFQPDRWPGGDPEHYFSVGPYGDSDNSPSKDFILRNKDRTEVRQFFARGYARRPAEELYDLRNDPAQLHNVAARSEYKATVAQLRNRLSVWMRETADPRATDNGDRFDAYPYYGKPVAKEAY